MPGDACRTGLTTTVFDASGKRVGVDRIKRPKRPRYDCFYVYPTISDQQRPQATLTADPVLRSVALYQAGRYTRGCRVFAPVYRQVTIYGLLHPDEVTDRMREQAYLEVRAAWREYLQRYNHGRGVVLLGHSQGTFYLKRLVAEEIDRSAAQRRRLISAVLLGGNVEVAEGSDRGGTFQNVPACRSATQTGCVIAFSTFGETPPDPSRFGRARTPGLEVLCTNPASLAGGSAPLDAVYPTKAFAKGTIDTATQVVGVALPTAATPWIRIRGPYVGRCSSAGGADVLLLTPQGAAPALRASPDASWGLHLLDANIALGNLERVVAKQAAAYRRAH